MREFLHGQRRLGKYGLTIGHGPLVNELRAGYGTERGDGAAAGQGFVVRLRREAWVLRLDQLF